MLRHDGWQVVDLTAREGRPRLYARDRRGRELDVAFRPVATADEDEGASGPAPLRETGRPGVDRLTRVVVHLGSFSRTDVLWASRQGGVHLLDGHQLQRGASCRSAGNSATRCRPPLGDTDASVVAVAERVKTLRVATLDRRHFTVVRTQRGEAFTLYPA
ncbi:hypothetical protein [Streptomyces sp. NWU339]|uniref:hypothetical protein n=1 Tax=Streptomyces sp. NWU339 TaxID=2185284 RepID=UPI00215B1B83|nr:hypothetical protein [Streptomyces sp. NWU339]